MLVNAVDKHHHSHYHDQHFCAFIEKYIYVSHYCLCFKLIIFIKRCSKYFRTFGPVTIDFFLDQPKFYWSDLLDKHFLECLGLHGLLFVTEDTLCHLFPVCNSHCVWGSYSYGIRGNRSSQQVNSWCCTTIHYWNTIGKLC